MSNVLEEVMQSLSPAVVAKVAASVGEQAEQTQTSLGLAAAAVLASMRGASHDEGHHAALATLLNDKAHRSSVLADPSAHYASHGAGAALGTHGDKLVNTIFGANRERITNEIAESGGIGSASANQLLGLVAPHVVAVVGRDLRATGDGSAASLKLLLDQHSGLSPVVVPAGLAQSIGMPSILASGAVTSAAAAVKHTSLPAATAFGLPSVRMPAWLRSASPLLAVFAALLGTMWLLAKVPKPPTTAVVPTPTTASTVPKSSAAVAPTPVGNVVDARAAAEAAVMAPPKPAAVAVAEAPKTAPAPVAPVAVVAAAAPPVAVAVAPVAAAPAPAVPTPGVTTFFAPSKPFTAETFYNPDYKVAAVVAPVVVAAAPPVAVAVAPVATAPAPAAQTPGVTTLFAPSKPFTAETYYNPDYKVAAVVTPAPTPVAAAPVATIANCQSAVSAAVKTGDIRFQTARATLADSSRAALDRLASAIKMCPGVRLKIEGHTDSEGTNENNQTLSESRAKAVAQYLSAAGIDSNRVTSIGYGEDKPIASNDTAEGKAKNRRIELIVEKL
jgi:outer membrane protein OmpA-like peptidoglycan-associated protein